MTSDILSETSRARHALLGTLAAVLAVTLTLVLLQPVSAHPVTPPSVPANLEVLAGHKAFLQAHAVGTQNYMCLPTASGFAWTLVGPQATLFSRDRQAMTHFLSPNPAESGTPRATWQDSRDSSSVWALKIAESADPAFVAPGAIPWFLLQAAGTQAGPTGGDRLAATTFIQRVNTAGGSAPATGCTTATEVGARAFVPYSADYVFYRAKAEE